MIAAYDKALAPALTMLVLQLGGNRAKSVRRSNRANVRKLDDKGRDRLFAGFFD